MSSTPVIPSSPSKKSSGMTMKTRRRIDTTWRLLVALIFIAYALFPVVYVIGTSLNPSGSLQTSQIFPSNPSLANYQKLLTYICEIGYEHHVSINLARTAKSVNEALGKYLGWDMYHHQ